MTQLNLILSEPKETQKYDWQDVLGAKVEKKSSKKRIILLCFPIHGTSRKLFKHKITSESPEKLVKTIQNMAYLSFMPEIFNQTYVKKFKIIINPNSGRGVSRRVWSSVSCLFEACEVSVSYTERRFHATEIVQSLNLREYEGILVISGDGLVHEVINALCKRENGDLDRMYPIGVIPAGSANALAQTVCEKSGEPVSAEVCAFLAIKGKPVPFDISLVKFDSGLTVYSFLSVFWAFIADVDIGSEKCRCCGACRFDLYGFWRVLALKRYHGSITWDNGEYNGPVVYFMSCNTPFIGKDMKVAPKSEFDDGTNDLLLLGNVGRMDLIRVLLRQDAGNHLDSPRLNYVKTTKWTLTPSSNRGVFSIDGEAYPPEPIKVEVLQKYCSVYSLP